MEISGAKLSIRPELLPGGARVLDVGCGDGRHVAAAALRGCRTVGLDFDAAVLRDACRRLGALPADLVVGDAGRLPFRDAAFDAVICTETLEHVPDDRAAIAEIARTMRAGGTLLGAVPSHFTEVVYWKLSPGYAHAPGGHVRVIRPRALARELRGMGIAIEEIRYLHFVDSLVWLRFCLADRLRRQRPVTVYEQAIALAVAAERPVASWRRHVREAMPRSRLIGAIDALGALVWPKSLVFVGRKMPVRVGMPPVARAEGVRIA